MNFSFFVFVLFYLKSIDAINDDCSSPWEKVNDKICLLLNSNIKTWNHAQISCNYYGGDLLFINNEEEKKEIDEFLNNLLRYRFNLKSLAWLDAIRRSDEWVWSHNNQTVSYNNWASSNLNINTQSNCACFKLRDKLWKSCDCNTKQHFICRKSDRAKTELIQTTQSTTKQTTTKYIQVKNSNEKDLSQEEKSIIVSSLALMNEEESKSLESNSKKLLQNDMKILENLKKNSGFLRDPSLFVNIYRTKILKNSVIFSLYECQFGFGYYSAANDCTKYKICENWDDKYAILTLNKCVDGKVFSFKEFECVKSDGQVCDANAFVPV